MKLQDLNTQQLKAVQTVSKPVLVFAGAGSGKTRVLTYKVWHLIKEKLFKPEEILALTFTNKACLLYTSPSPRDMRRSRMPSSA